MMQDTRIKTVKLFHPVNHAGGIVVNESEAAGYISRGFTTSPAAPAAQPKAPIPTKGK